MKRRFNNLSVYRILVTLGIVVFHFFYYTTNPRNVVCQLLAVQVAGLTALSGFLLSQKEISDTKKFYKDYFLKILIPIVSAIVIVFVIDSVVAIFVRPSTFWGLFYIKQFYYDGPIIQFGNLWYIPYILICYLITPILKKKEKLPKIIAVALALIAEYFVYYFAHVRLQILPFMVGYIIGSLKFEKYVSFSKDSVSRIVVWCLLLGASIFIRYFPFNGVLNTIKGLWHPFNDALIGISTFFAFAALFGFLNNFKNVGILNFTDKVSYHIYIVTLVFYGGVTSIINTNIYPVIQFVLIFVSTIVLAIINYLVNTLFKRRKQN